MRLFADRSGQVPNITEGHPGNGFAMLWSHFGLKTITPVDRTLPKLRCIDVTIVRGKANGAGWPTQDH